MNKLSDVIKENGETDFGKAIIKIFEDLGLGILSKADFEAFLYHQLTIVVDPVKVKDSYDWMRMLKVTPTKLRSLQMIRSAKFLDLNLENEDNWKLIFNEIDGKKLETEDKVNGKVRIYIDDLHVHRLIERFVVEGGSSVDYTLNKNQLVLKYNEFLNLLNNILDKAKQQPLLAAINEDKSELKINKEFESLSNIFADMKEVYKDKAFSAIAEETLKVIIKIARKKVGV